MLPQTKKMKQTSRPHLWSIQTNHPLPTTASQSTANSSTTKQPLGPSPSRDFQASTNPPPRCSTFPIRRLMRKDMMTQMTAHGSSLHSQIQRVGLSPSVLTVVLDQVRSGSISECSALSVSTQSMTLGILARRHMRLLIMNIHCLINQTLYSLIRSQRDTRVLRRTTARRIFMG